jgi:hypothetical protein
MMTIPRVLRQLSDNGDHGGQEKERACSFDGLDGVGSCVGLS